MSRALNRTGRQIIYSCSWPAYQFDKGTPDYPSIAEHCNLWRNYDDIQDSWQSVTGIMDHFAKNQDDFIPVAKPGAWNDPDMVRCGVLSSQERPV